MAVDPQVVLEMLVGFTQEVKQNGEVKAALLALSEKTPQERVIELGRIAHDMEGGGESPNLSAMVRLLREDAIFKKFIEILGKD